MPVLCVFTQELQAEVAAHRKHLNHILEKGRSLAKSNKSEGEEVLQRCARFLTSGLNVHFPLHLMSECPVLLDK